MGRKAKKPLFIPMPKYAAGGFMQGLEDVGAGVYGVAAGTLGSLTGGATDNLTDRGMMAIQKGEALTPQQIQEQNKISGYGKVAGAIGAGYATGNYIGATKEGLKGLNQGLNSKAPGSTQEYYNPELGVKINQNRPNTGLNLLAPQYSQYPYGGFNIPIDYRRPGDQSYLRKTQFENDQMATAMNGGNFSNGQNKLNWREPAYPRLEDGGEVTNSNLNKDGLIRVSKPNTMAIHKSGDFPKVSYRDQLTRSGLDIPQHAYGGPTNSGDFDNYKGFYSQPNKFGPQKYPFSVAETPRLYYPDGGFVPIDPLNQAGYARKPLSNSDGSTSTESTMGIGPYNGKFYNIPTVIDGKRYSPDEAVKMFQKTGVHMGEYKTQEEADSAADSREKVNQAYTSSGLIRKAYGGEYKDREGFKGFPVDKQLRYHDIFAGGGQYLAEGGEANAEVEKDEMMRMPDGTTSQVHGPSHEEGGVPVNIPSGTHIFSDRLKSADGKTFADEAAKYKVDKYEKILKDPKASPIEKKTVELMMKRNNQQLDRIFNEQEQLKHTQGIEQQNDLMAMGGIMEYKKGGIHIKPENKGKFTAAAKRAGMGVQAYAHHVLAHKDSHSSTLVKRAVFAENAKKWHHANGGVHGVEGAYNIPDHSREALSSYYMGEDYRDRYSTNHTPNPYYENGGVAEPLYDNANKFMTEPWRDRYAISGRGVVGKDKYTFGGVHAITPDETPKKPFIGVAGFPMMKYGGYYSNGGYMYPDGGDTDWVGMPSFYTNKMQPTTTIDPSNNGNSINQFLDKTNAPGQFNSKDAGLLDQNNLMGAPDKMDMSYNPSQDLGPTQKRPTPIDYNKIGSQVLNAGVQNAGSIYDLYKTRFGNKYDTVNYGSVNPTFLNPDQALKDADVQNRINRDSIKDASGGNAGAYLSGAIASGSQNAMNKARINTDYQNANAGISNQFGMYNKQLQVQNMIDNMKNKARSEDIARQALRGTGQNLASQSRDYKQSAIDQDTVKMIGQMYPNYSYDPNKGWFFNSQGMPLFK